jgi:hypothetical protein
LWPISKKSGVDILESSHSERQLRKYRVDKKRPKRTRVTVEKDMGTYQQRDITTFPQGATTKRRIIPNKSNGNWLTVFNQVVKLRKALNTNQWFFYDMNDEILGEVRVLEAYDLAIAILKNINAFREEIHGNRRGQAWTILVLRKREAVKSANLQ